jgi:hypothetical protein
MLTLRKILDFYIHSSIHVGVAVFCLVQLSVPQWTSYSVLVFFGTVIGYNFLKYFEWFLANKRLRYNIIGILSVSILATIAFLLLFLEQGAAIQFDLLVALVLVVLYPFIRKLGWLKPFFVSIVVSYVTVSIPLKDNSDVAWFFAQRFLLLSSLMIPFEILDSTTDAVSLQTLPHLFGVARTKQIGYVLVGLYSVASFHALSIHYPCLIYALSSGVAIYFSSQERSWYYTSFWVESLPIVWWLISIVLK